MHACMHAYMHACVHACMHACGSTCQLLSNRPSNHFRDAFKLCILKRKSIRNVDEGMCEQIYMHMREKRMTEWPRTLLLESAWGRLGEVFGLSGDILWCLGTCGRDLLSSLITIWSAWRQLWCFRVLLEAPRGKARETMITHDDPRRWEFEKC